jgi:hypothetical protein
MTPDRQSAVTAEDVAREIADWLKEPRPESFEMLVRDRIEKVVDTEQARWQERIDRILRAVLPDVDGSGCDSGDPLDLTACEIEIVINHLRDEIYELRGIRNRLADKLAWWTGKTVPCEITTAEKESKNAAS